jgi:isocitrate dehydrogenase
LEDNRVRFIAHYFRFPTTINNGAGMSTSLIKVPAQGQKIIPGQPIPDNPVIPFIEGDGIGVDITPVMQKVVDAAVQKSYGGKRRISWMEVYAGEKGDPPVRTRRLAAGRNHHRLQGLFGIHQGAADHPGGRRHPLAQCRPAPGDGPLPVRTSGALLQGHPSPLKDPSKTDMVIFRENTEDIYCGVEWQAESPAARN